MGHQCFYEVHLCQYNYPGMQRKIVQWCRPGPGGGGGGVSPPGVGGWGGGGGEESLYWSGCLYMCTKTLQPVFFSLHFHTDSLTRVIAWLFQVSVITIGLMHTGNPAIEAEAT